MVRLSGLMVFAPVFSSSAIAPRIKVGFVFAMTILLAPAIAAVPGARAVLDTRGGAGGAWRGAGVWTFADVVERSVDVCGNAAGAAVQFFAGESAGPELHD